MTTNAYTAFENHLERISWRGIKPGLERMQAALGILGHPQKNLKIIHIAGTNGKGSVCHLFAQLLGLSGYRVGLYTSPHVVDYRERIQYFDPGRAQGELQKMGIPRYITREELIETHGYLQSRLPATLELTYFEYTTVLALVFFARNKMDYVVLETGMGGRWDATNACESLLSGITSISLDHMEILGNTPAKILSEKLEIIKNKNHFLFGPDNLELIAMAKRHCQKKDAIFYPLLEAEKKLSPEELLAVEQLEKPGILKRNLVFAFALGHIFESLGNVVDLKSFARCTQKYFPPARFEVLRRDPLLVLDGAHNEDGLKHLGDSWQKTHGSEFDLYFGCLTDRNPESIVKPVLPAYGEVNWIVFEAGARSPSAAHYVAAIKNWGGQVIGTGSKLLDRLRSSKRPVLVCGSLYLCAEVREYFVKSKI